MAQAGAVGDRSAAEEAMAPADEQEVRRGDLDAPDNEFPLVVAADRGRDDGVVREPG